MKKPICFIVAFLLSATAFTQTPQVASGRIIRHENFRSAFVTPRNVDVWLPDGYTPANKYAVLYMHDGQMLFDSTKTWNHKEWEADETAGKLIRDRKVSPFIIVAIWNVPAERFADYFPQKILDSIGEPAKTTLLRKQLVKPPDADNYLKFIVRELKPFIDSAYATRRNVENTFIMGSSMGGLISAYALCEYPGVFGGAACLSTHSPLLIFDLIDENTDRLAASKFRQYLAAHLPAANTRKVYFDYGDQTGDKYYAPYQKAIDAVMAAKGYSGKYWQTKFYPGENHSEVSWAKRLDVPLKFLLGTNK